MRTPTLPRGGAAVPTLAPAPLCTFGPGLHSAAAVHVGVGLYKACRGGVALLLLVCRLGACMKQVHAASSSRVVAAEAAGRWGRWRGGLPSSMKQVHTHPHPAQRWCRGAYAGPRPSVHIWTWFTLGGGRTCRCGVVQGVPRRRGAAAAGVQAGGMHEAGACGFQQQSSSGRGSREVGAVAGRLAEQHEAGSYAPTPCPKVVPRCLRWPPPLCAHLDLVYTRRRPYM